MCCVIGIRSFTSAALQCGDTPVRPVGTPTIFPVPSRLKEESSSCKIHYRHRGVFLLGGACHGRQGEKGEELRPNAVYAHDPALIPEQARGNMAACTTTERGEDWRGREVCVRLYSVISELLMLLTAILPGRCNIGCSSQARNIYTHDCFYA